MLRIILTALCVRTEVPVGRFEIFAVLPGTSAWDALRRFDERHPLGAYGPEVGGVDVPDSVLPNLVVIPPDQLARRWRDVLPPDVAVYLNFALLHSAPVLALHDVPEAALAEIAAAADASLMPTEPPLWVPYLPPRERPLVFAVAARLTGDDHADRPAGGISGHLDRARDVGFSPDGSTLASLGAGTVKIWDLASGRCTATAWADGDRVRFAPDGRTVLVLSHVGGVLLDARSGAELARVRSRDTWFSPDGSYLATVDHSADASRVVEVAGRRLSDIDHSGDMLHVLDLRGGEEVLAIPGTFASFALHGPGLVVAAPVGLEQRLRGDIGVCTVYRSGRGEVATRLPGRYPTFGPGGTVLTVLDNGAALWDGRSGRRLRSMPFEGALDVSALPGERPILFARAGTVAIRDRWNQYGVWKATSGQRLCSVRGSRLVDVPRAPLMVGVGADTVAVDARTGEERYRLDADEVRAHPAGSLLATTRHAWWSVPGIDSTVFEKRTSVVAAASGEPMFDVPGIEPRFSPDGRLLVTLRDDSRIELWEAGTGRHAGSVTEIRVLSRAFRGEGGGMGPGDGEPTMAPVSRYAEVVAPAAVSPATPFKITAQLVRQPPEDVPEAPPIEVAPTIDEAGRPTGAEPVLAVVYASAAFEVTSPARAEIPVPADADSPVVEFALRARADAEGPHAVNVVLWQGSSVLGQVVAVVRITRVPGVPFLRRTSVSVATPAETDPPDVVITVNRTTYQGRDTLHYTYRWQTEHWPVAEAGQVELRSSASEWLAGEFAKLSAASVGAAHGAVGERGIEIIGENLYRELFTEELRAFYRRFAPMARSVLLYSNEPWIPWELVRPWSDDPDDDSDDFLCARFDFARWYYSDAGRSPRPRLDVRQIGPVVPATNLVAALREGRYLDDLPARWPPVTLSQPTPVRAADVLNLMGDGRTHIFHFATHGVTPTDRDGPATIELDQGPLKTEELVGPRVARGLRAAAPLVFVNACHSGHQSVALVRDDGWVQRLLDLGCSAFIGANWAVDDELAADFAIAVYDRLVAGGTVAAAVREARTELRRRDPDNATWLAYSLYAHPHLVVHPIPSDNPSGGTG
jgi:hypothetical protein